MIGKIYTTAIEDPYSNLAFEEYLCRTCGEDDIILFLWQNHDTVVIGRNQNAWSECSLSAMEKDGVKLSRRYTGGGAVFHDRGNLNFSFIFRSADMDKTKGYNVIKDALAILGIEAVISGRNDLTTTDGRKFSGNAFRLYNGVFLHHGTLLIRSDTGRMSRYLNPSFEKLNSKGVASIKSRVCNLSDLNPSVTPEQMKQVLTEAMKQAYPPCTQREADYSAEEITQIRNSLLDPAWLYGKSSKADITLDHRFSWGSIELGLTVKDSKVAEIIVYTDALETELAEELINELTGADFVPGGLSGRLDGPDGSRKKDLKEWLIGLSL